MAFDRSKFTVSNICNTLTVRWLPMDQLIVKSSGAYYTRQEAQLWCNRRRWNPHHNYYEPQFVYDTAYSQDDVGDKRTLYDLFNTSSLPGWPLKWQKSAGCFNTYSLWYKEAYSMLHWSLPFNDDEYSVRLHLSVWFWCYWNIPRISDENIFFKIIDGNNRMISIINLDLK